MKHTANALILGLVAVALVIAPMLAVPADAGVRVSFAYTSSPADIRVWLDRQGHHGSDYYDDDYYDDDYDVYPSADDVVLYFRASRSTYATVYVVDTAGYIHVVHPFSMHDQAFIRGGRVYKVYLRDFGYGHGFDRGVAYAFAVSSPVPFNYDYDGAGIFGAGFGFRIYGDPYVASKRFYLSLIAGGCDRHLIGIGHARFYVREYVRYPRYLCAGWHDYYGVRQYCRGGCSVYKYYHQHARDPHRVLHPKFRIKSAIGDYTRIDHHGNRGHQVRHKTRKIVPKTVARAGGSKHSVRTRVDSHRGRTVHNKVVRTRAPNSTRKVVRSSKKSFVKGHSRSSQIRKFTERNRAKTIKKNRNVNTKRAQKFTKTSSRKQGARVNKSTKAKSKSRATKASAKSSSRGGKAKRGRR